MDLQGTGYAVLADKKFRCSKLEIVSHVEPRPLEVRFPDVSVKRLESPDRTPFAKKMHFEEELLTFGNDISLFRGSYCSTCVSWKLHENAERTVRFLRIPSSNARCWRHELNTRLRVARFTFSFPTFRPPDGEFPTGRGRVSSNHAKLRETGTNLPSQDSCLNSLTALQSVAEADPSGNGDDRRDVGVSTPAPE